MKHKLYVWLICIALLSAAAPASFAAEDGAPPIRDADTAQRAALRLRELGYYTGGTDGLMHDGLTAALEAFCLHNGVEPSEDASRSLLFSRDALAAPDATADTDAPASAAPDVTGRATPWSDVQKRLLPGRTYTLTACYGGASFRMRFTGGTNHAHMTPLLDDDADAIVALQGGLRDYGKLPVVIRLGDTNVAASLQAYRHSVDAGDADAEYSLYFEGSVSDIGSLPDVDHIKTVRIAAGGA